MIRTGSRFSRVELRRRARAFVLGLLAELPRKNCWTIAEHAGDPSPDGMQHLLARAKWDAGSVRDDVRGYVIEHLGDPGAVLVIDETGDIKKGTATAGVQRQYTGTARADRERPGRHLPRIRRPAHDTSHQMRWSRWRRRHQHRARTCRYQRQTSDDQGT